MSETSATVLEAKRASLSRELSEFLVELSIGVHRYAMYPAGHPSLASVLENILGRLADVFEDHPTLSIGVAERQLVIDGVATDRKHPVLSDLARRLHGHQLAAISFSRGVTPVEVSSLLEVLATESERGGTPVGFLPEEELPRWEHAWVHRVGYGNLEIRDGAGDPTPEIGQVGVLWLGMARAALAGEEPVEELPDANVLARAIQDHGRDAAYDQAIFRHLLRLAHELKGAQGSAAEETRRRVSALMNELDDATLARLVEFGGDAALRKRFLIDANQSLAVESVVKLLRVAATSAQQNISTSMTRLLNKLAAHAERGSIHMGSQADTALRENVEALIEDWELKDPNPEAYTAVLDAMSHAAPVLHVSHEGEPELSGAERIAETALEVDAYGPIVTNAVADLIKACGTGRLLQLLAEAPAGNSAAERIREYLTSPAQFREILHSGQVDDEALLGLIRHMGSAAVDPLLDVLAESDSRSVRRRVFDALVGMGPWVGRRAAERLADGRWFVLRNMLALLQRLEPLPEGFDPQPFLDHPDPRVRREVLPVALRDSARRERTLVAALADEDERMVRMALLELRERVPDALVPTLANRVVASPERSPEMRALGVKALGSTSSHLAMNVLLGIVSPGKTIFGRAKLAANAPEVLVALNGLARGWADDPQVVGVLRMAARSKDPALRRAVREGVAPETARELGLGGEG